MAPPAPRIFVSAGEPSGDQHAAALVAALRRRRPDAVVEAFGGPALAAAGAEIRFPMERYTALGFLEVLHKLGPHLRLLRGLRRDLRAGRYDLVIAVDYPGFNLRLAEAARRAGVRTLYYIAPQLWAWRPGRARRLARGADRLAVILPFEPDFFRSLGIEAEYVGHPLAERAWPSREEARERLGIDPLARVLAVFPGSRAQEVARLWEPFRDAATRLLAEGRCDRALVAGTPDGAYPDAGSLEVVRAESSPVLAAADVALVKSGTTTLEAALAGTPMVVAYRVNPLSYAIARRVVRVPWISLVNLVAGREVVPELVQDAASPDRLVEHLHPLLDPSSPATMAQRAGFAELRETLGGAGASERAAALAASLLES